MHKDAIEIDTALTIEQVKRIFQSTLGAYSRKVEFGPLEAGDNPFDTPADFEAFASLFTLTGGWIVQIGISGQDHGSSVLLVSVGSSALGRAWGGLKNTVSRAASREKALAVLDALRTADPALRFLDGQHAR